MFKHFVEGLSNILEDFVFQFPLPRDKESFDFVLQMQCPVQMVKDILSEKLYGIVELDTTTYTSEQIWFDGKEILILTTNDQGELHIYWRRSRAQYSTAISPSMFKALRRVKDAKMFEEINYFWLTKMKHYSSV